MAGVDHHSVGGMPFVPTPHEDVFYFLRLGVRLMLDVVNVGQKGECRAQALDFALVHLAVIQQNGLIGRIELDAGIGVLPQDEHHA